MSYFTAAIAGDGRAWKARDVDVEDADSLGDLAESMRGVAHGEHPVLVVIEHEDEWFALVRVDGDEDARVFVSDLPASSRGPYADLLAPAADVETANAGAADGGALPAGSDEVGVVGAVDGDVPGSGPAPEPSTPAGTTDPPDGGLDELDALMDSADNDGEVPDVGDLDEPDPLPPPAWAGDPALLDDLGVDRGRLCALTEDNTDDPAAVLAEIGEQVGFADLIEALR